MVIILLTLWVARSKALYARSQEHQTIPVPIAIEHTTPADVHILIGAKADQSIVDITNRTKTAITVVLPNLWMQREVRGTALANVQQESQPNARSAWTLPARATVSFAVKQRVERIQMTHTPNKPLNVSYRYVDVETGTTNEFEKIMTSATFELPPTQ